MRCSFDGLASVVRRQLGGNPLSGDGDVFVNRRRTMLRVLYFEPVGIACGQSVSSRGVLRCRQRSINRSVR